MGFCFAGSRASLARESMPRTVMSGLLTTKRYRPFVYAAIAFRDGNRLFDRLHDTDNRLNFESDDLPCEVSCD
ncbi:hypothetical protein WN48_11240 [Eufriesea mexicana]|uniref:Uncharacterized protein n=1 Tax=Eufriesea mexicana TaxID=516756 RepID=A0A310SMH3_9HYME|nr:hypothetical protein WN48_11240 [Eufriesea mexicana]